MINFKLKELMDRSNLTIADVHRITGISRSSLAPLVNNPDEVKAIRTETIDKLCSLFGVNSADLIEFIPDKVKLDVKSLLHTTYASKTTYILYELNFQTGYLQHKNFIQIKMQYFADNSQLFITSNFIDKPILEEFINQGEITGEFNHSEIQREGYDFLANLNSEIVEEITDNLVKMTSELFVEKIKEPKDDLTLVTYNWEKTEKLSFPYPHKTLHLYKITKTIDDYEISYLY